MEQTITNFPPIDPAEIIKQVSTVDQYGQYTQWSGCITAKQLGTLRTAVKEVGGETPKVSDYDLGRGAARRQSCSGLEVQGVSQLVDIYSTVCFWNHKHNRIECRVDDIVLYLVIDNRAYFVPCYGYEKPGTTFELSLPRFDPSRVEVPYNCGWKFDEPSPKKIGKATAKKLAAWVDWLDRENASRAAYMKHGTDTRDALFARLEASGVEYKQFGNIVNIRNSILYMDVEIGVYDIHLKRIGVDLNAFSGDYLSLMLDSEITLTPKH